jgi:hypothetical protein
MGDALEKNISLASMLTGMGSKLFGSSSSVEESTGGGTSTKQTVMDQASINAMLKSLMEGTTGRQGLAAVSQGQRGAGLYNSNVRSMMVNDLIARSTAEVAKAGAPTVETKTPSTATRTTTTPGMVSGGTGLLGLAALVGGSAAGRKFLKDQFGDLLGDGSSSLSSSVFDAAGIGATTVSDLSSYGADLTSVGGDMGVGAASDLSGFITNFADTSSIADWGSAAADVASSVGDLGAGYADIWMDAGLDVGADVAVDAAAGIGMPWFTLGKAVLSGDPVGYIGDTVGAIGDTVGNVVEDVGDFLGGGCFITTAICQTYGKPDDCEELTTLRQYRDTFLKENHPEEIQTYYNIAPAIVQAIQNRDDAAVVWTDLYRHYLVPAIEAIQEGQFESAYSIYKDMVATAKEIAHG